MAADGRLPGHVHAGRLRPRGDRVHPGQERDAHDEHELHGLCASASSASSSSASGSHSADSGPSASGNLGGLAPLSKEIGITIGDTTWGMLGGTGFALTGSSYDVGVIAFFLFQLVFMDTTATIPTGAMAERFRFEAVRDLRVVHLGDPLPGLRQLGVGRRLALPARDARTRQRLRRLRRVRRRPRDRRLGCARRSDRARAADRQVQQGRLGNPILGHNQILAILGTFILAFGWFGFNPGSTFGASGNGDLRIGMVAVATMLASASGPSSAMIYTWRTESKPNPGMMANGMLAGLVAITAPSGFVSPIASARHRPRRRVPGRAGGRILRPGSRSTTRSARSRSTG